ncbi:MAG: tetratricopeptide repeat protein, partial [Bdellovibrionales bacterium]|nr:tetratricopeptide repeat protein [Bdellovibrionales bacterium]
KAEKSKEEDEVNKIKEREAINHTVDSLFEIQRLVKVGRLDEALVKIRSLQDAEPNVAASYEMQGGIFYIQNDYPRALDAYQKALRLNPENVDSFNMKKYLESLTNTSSNKKLGQL